MHRFRDHTTGTNASVTDASTHNPLPIFPIDHEHLLWTATNARPKHDMWSSVCRTKYDPHLSRASGEKLWPMLDLTLTYVSRPRWKLLNPASATIAGLISVTGGTHFLDPPSARHASRWAIRQPMTDAAYPRPRYVPWSSFTRPTSRVCHDPWSSLSRPIVESITTHGRKKFWSTTQIFSTTIQPVTRPTHPWIHQR